MNNAERLSMIEEVSSGLGRLRHLVVSATEQTELDTLEDYSKRLAATVQELADEAHARALGFGLEGEPGEAFTDSPEQAGR